eukprot:gb/GFBE01005329.1/.p1 GENE.gb/GFBE01005329.1/~~gb/GFBE01005329.1/.p1  ORF type:complete len:790 (+),score=177.46 gb/GFBE01005329.1/:1-2370(+)
MSVLPSMPGMLPSESDDLQIEIRGLLQHAFASQREWIDNRLKQQEQLLSRLMVQATERGRSTACGGNANLTVTGEIISRGDTPKDLGAAGAFESESSDSRAPRTPIPAFMSSPASGGSFSKPPPATQDAFVKPQKPSRQSTEDLTAAEASSLGTGEVSNAQIKNSESAVGMDAVVPISAPIAEAATENDELQDLVSRLEDMFDLLDLDASGTINRGELKKAFEQVGIPPIPAIQAFLQNGSNMEIDRLEWLHTIEDASNQAPDEFTTFAKKLIDVQSEKGSILSDAKKPYCRTYIRHDSQNRMLWDMLMMILLFWVCLSMPLVLGFGEIAWISSVDRVADVLFLLDVAFNFWTTYIDRNDVLVTHNKQMALHYLRTWFLLDFISSVPWDLVTAGLLPSLQSIKMLKIGKIAKVFKLLRLGKMIKSFASSELLETIEDQFSPKASQTLGRLINLIVVTFMVCHWLACFLAVFDNGMFEFYLGPEASAIEQKYVSAFYWAVTTLTTVGYGDFVPKSDQERGYVMIAMLIGSAFFGYIIGSITSVITDMDIDKRKFNERMDVVQAWLDFHERMPAILRRRIRRHFKEHYRNKTIADDATIVSELSGMLRADTAYFIIHEKVHKNPVFRGLPGSALASLVCVLKKTTAKPDENIVIAGDPGAAMYVIIEGQAEVTEGELWVPSDVPREYAVKLAKDLDEGASFGEEILFSLEQSYRYTVTARASVSMYELAMDSFQYQFRNMPELTQRMLVNLFRSRKNMMRLRWKEVKQKTAVSLAVPDFASVVCTAVKSAA